jgi:hypothetical protein
MSSSLKFHPGRNIAMKVPPHQHAQTVRFYAEVLGLERLPDLGDSACFEFGGKRLWIDCVPGMSQAELWLEVVADDLEAAATHFERHGVTRCDGIEPLPDDFAGFWISSPAGIVHLVAGDSAAGN